MHWSIVFSANFISQYSFYFLSHKYQQTVKYIFRMYHGSNGTFRDQIKNCWKPKSKKKKESKGKQSKAASSSHVTIKTTVRAGSAEFLLKKHPGSIFVPFCFSPVFLLQQSFMCRRWRWRWRWRVREGAVITSSPRLGLLEPRDMRPGCCIIQRGCTTTF